MGKIRKYSRKNKWRSKRPETYIFRTSLLRPLFWQILGKSVFSILHTLSRFLQQTALKIHNNLCTFFPKFSFFGFPQSMSKICFSLRVINLAKMPLYWPRRARVYRTSWDAQNLCTVIKGVIVLKPGTYGKKLQHDSRGTKRNGWGPFLEFCCVVVLGKELALNRSEHQYLMGWYPTENH